MEFYDRMVFEMEGAEEFTDAVNALVDQAIRERWDTYSELDQTTIRKAAAKHGGMPHPPHVQWADDNEPTEVIEINAPRLHNPHARMVQIPQLLESGEPLSVEVREAGVQWVPPKYRIAEFTFDTWAFTVPVITNTYYDQETNILYLAAHKRIYRMQVWKPSPPQE